MYKTIEIKPIPEKTRHPDVEYKDVLLQHEFTLALIAPKGSGKTTLIVRMLEFYKGYFHNVFIFSPTIKSDGDKFAYLKRIPLKAENTPLKEWIEKMNREKEDDQTVVGKRKAGMPTTNNEVFSPYFNEEEELFEDYQPSDLEDILNTQRKMIELLEKHKQPIGLANRLLFIFDDLVGSNLFGNQRQNAFKLFNVRHRHFSASMMMVTQAYKEIPPTVRTQYSGLITFRNSNSKELHKMYEEFQDDKTEKQWMAAYNYATEEPFGFLFINTQKPIGKRMFKNFQQELIYAKERLCDDIEEDKEEALIDKRKIESDTTNRKKQKRSHT